MATVELHPFFTAFQASFFLSGLRTILGAEAIRNSVDGFDGLKRSRFLKLIVRDGGTFRVFVDEHDSPRWDDTGLAWCDVYAKRNIDPAQPPSAFAEKVVPEGPTFPIRAISMVESVRQAVTTLRLSAKATEVGPLSKQDSRVHLRDWYTQWSYGLPLAEYRPATSNPNYLFFSSSIWKDEGDTNRVRASFIEASRSVSGIAAESGFTPRRSGAVPGYEPLTLPRRLSHDEFIERTRRSVVAFNNPAVFGAFSWRLGESLALGKAIVSTPVVRMLPAPLVHGEHVHFVEPTVASMRSAIEVISRDHEYRGHLERNARRYYDDHVSPEATVRRVLGAAGWSGQRA